MASSIIRNEHIAPDYRRFSDVETPFTATEDGYISFSLTGTWTPCLGKINTFPVASVQIVNTNSYPMSVQFPPVPIFKGDVCIIDTQNATGNSGYMRFYKIKKS